MSFNFREVAQAAQEIESQLVQKPAPLDAVELVEFPMAYPLADINVALRFGRISVVFSLKQPWIGVFVLDSSRWRVSKQKWSTAFGSSVHWASAVVGQKLVQVQVPPGDRGMLLRFESGVTVKFDLFPNRPNWHLISSSGEVSSWRASPTSALSSRPPFNPAGLTSRFASSDEAYRYYLEQRRQFALENLKQKSLAALRARLVKLRRIEQDLNESWEESQKADQIRAWGELLKGVLHEDPRDYRSSSLKVWEQTIPLDESLSLPENLLHFFSRYKKLQRTAREVVLRRSGIEKETQRVRAAIKDLELFKPQEESHGPALLKLRELAILAGVWKSEFDGTQQKAPPKPAKWEKKWQKSGLKSFQSKEGLRIWVGRNHQENEELVIRLARGNDLWFHIKGRPGAHVIVQLPSGKSASLETMLDAASLVAYYSDISEGEKIEVDYTFRKNVKRVAGKREAFLVTYNQNKTLVVSLDKARLERLLSQIQEAY